MNIKKVILYIDDNDKVHLEADGFSGSIDDLQEVFHILASGTKMIATKVEEMK